MHSLNGSRLGGRKLVLSADSEDSKGLIVENLDRSVEWKALRDHFAAAHPASVSLSFSSGGFRVTQKAVLKGGGHAEHAAPQRPREQAAPQRLRGDPGGDSAPPRQRMRPRDDTGDAPQAPWRSDATARAVERLLAGARASAEASALAAPETIGEVRFKDTDSAHRAVDTLDGSTINGYEVQISLDPTSQDGTKIMVHGLPEGFDWKELKAFMGRVGTVAYANLRSMR